MKNKLISIILLSIFLVGVFSFLPNIKAQTPILMANQPINNVDAGTQGIVSSGIQGQGLMFYGNNYVVSVVTYYCQREAGTTGSISGVIYRANTPINGNNLNDSILVDTSTTAFNVENIYPQVNTNDQFIPELYTGISMTFHDYNVTTGYYYWIGFVINSTISTGYVTFAYNSTGAYSPFNNAYLNVDDMFYASSGMLCGNIIGNGDSAINVSPILLRVYITGDIFSNSVIAQAPTQITLKQSTTYTLTGQIYINDILDGNGNYSLALSPLSTSTTIFNYMPTVYNTYSCSNGTFNFQFTPRTATETVYQLLLVNVTVTSSISNATYITSQLYDFGFYAIGGFGSGGIPYPSSTDFGDSGFSPTLTISPFFWAGLVVLLVFSLVFASIAGKDGLMVGVVVGIFLASIFGLFPIYTIIVSILIGVFMVLSKTGYIGGTG